MGGRLTSFLPWPHHPNPEAAADFSRWFEKEGWRREPLPPSGEPLPRRCQGEVRLPPLCGDSGGCNELQRLAEKYELNAKKAWADAQDAAAALAFSRTLLRRAQMGAEVLLRSPELSRIAPPDGGPGPAEDVLTRRDLISKALWGPLEEPLPLKPYVNPGNPLTPISHIDNGENHFFRDSRFILQRWRDRVDLDKRIGRYLQVVDTRGVLYVSPGLDRPVSEPELVDEAAAEAQSHEALQAAQRAVDASYKSTRDKILTFLHVREGDKDYTKHFGKS